MKKMSAVKQKFTQERLHLITEMQSLERENAELRATNEGQLRLIQNVTGHQKNKGALLNECSTKSGSTALSTASEESARSERLAKQLNRSKFLQLSDNPPPPLACEEEHPLLKTNWATFSDKNRGYLIDESIPPQIYTLIQEYRDKARCHVPGNDLAMLIDDFFADAHQIIKDTQLREIARVRNEANVEIAKLKSSLLHKPFTNHNLTA